MHLRSNKLYYYYYYGEDRDWTHDLLFVSPLPWPQDQGSLPKIEEFVLCLFNGINFYSFFLLNLKNILVDSVNGTICGRWRSLLRRSNYN